MMFLYLFLLCGILATSEGVGKVTPVLIWGSYIPPFDGIAAAETISPTRFEALLSAVDTQKGKLLVFTQNKFSIEELSGSTDTSAYTYLKTQNVRALPRVEDPVDVFSGRHMPHVSIYNSSNINTVEDALKESPHVQIRLPDRSENALMQNDGYLQGVIELVESKFPNTVVTAFLVSQEMPQVEVPRRVARQILQAAEEPKDNKPAGALVFNNVCVRIYTREVNVSVGQDSANFTQDDPLKVDTSALNCDSTNITLKVMSSNDEYSVTFELLRDPDEQSWQAISFTGKAKSEEGALVPETGELWAGDRFSFSCSSFQLFAKNGTSQFTFSGFQLEVGATLNETTGFSDSMDCSTWFTMPIWAGVVIALFYIFLLFIAILYLYEIKTNDRFDDPKGKTITVNAQD